MNKKWNGKTDSNSHYAVLRRDGKSHDEAVAIIEKQYLGNNRKLMKKELRRRQRDAIAKHEGIDPESEILDYSLIWLDDRSVRFGNRTYTFPYKPEEFPEIVTG